MFKWLTPKTSDAIPQKPPGTSAPSRRDDLIREAMVNAKTAREAIGEETLAKVRDMMQKQQQAKKPPQSVPTLAALKAQKDISPMEQAKKILLSMEPEKLSDHLRLLREHDKTH